MMTRRDPHGNQLEMELFILNDFVEDDHLLRDIERFVDFEFIYDVVAPLYSKDQGRPSIDPVVLFKMSLLQALYGIRSEERLSQEIHYNLAYRWFLGYGLKDRIPDHSTISYNRRVRFADDAVYDTIFQEILRQAIDHGLVSGEVVYTDSTHIRASASNSKYENHEETHVITEDESLLALVNDKRATYGQKAFEPAEDKMVTKQRKVSKTDPSSGYMHRDRKPQGFYHLAHATVDSKHNVILGLTVTPGNVHDSTVYLDHLDEVFQQLDVLPSYAGADAAYFSLDILEGLTQQGIQPVIGPRKYAGKKGKRSKYWFDYDPLEDVYVCFEGKRLHYKTTTRQGYVVYESQAQDCKICPSRVKCLYEKQGSIPDRQTRIIRRHIKEHYADETRAFLKTPIGKNLYDQRKETIERVFADVKELMGLRYAHYRGDKGIRVQVIMTGIANNVKKMATALARRENI